MINQISISILIVMLMTQCIYTQIKPPFKVEMTKESLDTTICFSLYPTNSLYLFHIQVNQNDASVTVIKNDPMKFNIVDTLNVISIADCIDSTSYSDLYFYPLDIIICEDLNFDSYPDLHVLRGLDKRTFNPNYNIWLFNPQRNKYELNNDFTKIISWNYRINTKEKTITTFQVGDFFVTDYVETTYEVKNNILVPIKRESLGHFTETDTSSTFKYQWKLEKLVRGKFEVIDQKIMTSDEALKYKNEHNAP